MVQIMTEAFTAQGESLDIYTVTRLNREARIILEGSFPPIWVQGEISNLSRPSSGHIYFSLKDQHSQVRCAMFRNRNIALKFTPENGMLVLARVNVSLYEDRGEFQLIIERMEPAGDGVLQREFEELKQRLFKEGLFSEEHKKPIPFMAKTVGVITSPTGAAIRDILSILKRRFPAIKIIIYPAAVQGEGAADQIIAGILTAEQRKECDALILTRGGGPLEDLWAFNNEKLARTIYQCSIPIVTGIGHEIDFTIADFVADHRAATPSAAAEMVSPDQFQIKSDLLQQNKKLLRLTNNRINELQQRISQLARRLQDPVRTIQTISQRLDNLNMRMVHLISTRISTGTGQITKLASFLDRKNPVYMLRLYRERCNHIQQRLQLAVHHVIKQCPQPGLCHRQQNKHQSNRP
jgi:exodeoxyribonuclease VII large subunit